MDHSPVSVLRSPRSGFHNGPRLGAILVLAAFLVYGCASTSSTPSLPEPVFIPEKAWVDQIEAPPELRQAIMRGQVARIPLATGYDLAVRIYGPTGLKAPVIMTHGLESHSGWFAQSAVRMAAQGHPVYAVDRRGSGLSGGPRGDMKAFDELIDDLRAVADDIAERHGPTKIFIVGHCFGAIPATAFAIRYPDRVQSLILSSSAIYTQTGLPFGQMMKIFFTPSGNRDFLVENPLESDDFTELASYEAFIRRDPLALQAATGDFFVQVYYARKYIYSHIDRLEMPVYMALAGQDPICDNPRNIDFFEKLPADDKMLVNYENARHILEFSPEKERFLTDLIFWLSRQSDDKE